MRTTLSIDDDVLSAALACQAGIQFEPPLKTRNGVPLLPVRAGTKRVKSRLVQLHEELR
jgi:hypothetical protein